MQNKRVFSRVSFKSIVYLEKNKALYAGKLQDICLQGALIEIKDNSFKAKHGDQVVFRLELPDSDIKISSKCELVHKEQNQYGVRFEETDIDSMTHLRNLIELNIGDSALVSEELQRLIRR
ncbi:MAG: PilZ domain-containing protein [Candidatus Marinimicrobia bacterium]|nr:PilZ domain-containing protein [Candidatus Neomarinimicrobiota bacterium]